MSEFHIKKYKIGKLKNPILIEGFPGIGDVAKLAVEYLIDKLNAQKILELYTSALPGIVNINEDSTIKMFSINFYKVKTKKRDIILMSGDVQPSKDDENYVLCNEIIKICKDLGVKEIITIGGIGLPETPKRIKVHGAVNNKDLIKKLKNLRITFDGNKTVKMILGATGLLMGIARLYNIDSFSLLVETSNSPYYVGMKEAREVLKLIDKYLELNIEFDELNEEIKNYEKQIRERQKLQTRYLEQSKESQQYIG